MYRPIWRPSHSAFVGYRPQDICKARGWDGNTIQVAPIKMGYLSLGGTTPASDIAAQAQLFGLPQPKITIIGTPQPTDPGGANVENNLDLWGPWIWSVLTGLPADITIAFANNDANGMPTAVSTLAQAGVEVVSCSWGMAEIAQGRASVLQMQAAVQQAIARNGMWMTAASGDNSADDGTSQLAVDCPSCIPEVLGIGGTNLVNKNGIWMDSAWGDGRPGDSGGGGGLSAYYGVPAYQSALNLLSRGVPDLAENADPNTGYMMISDGQQMCVGGTSGAAPVVAGFLAVARGAMKLKGLSAPPTPHALIYANATTMCKDVTTGSDGNPAKVGYDLATGNGVPSLPGWMAGFLGVTVPPPPTGTIPPPPPPVILPPVNPLPPGLQQQLIAAIDAEFQLLERQNPWLAPGILAPLNHIVDQIVIAVLSNMGANTSHAPGGVLGGILGGVLGGLRGGMGWGGGYPYPPVGYPPVGVPTVDPTTGQPIYPPPVYYPPVYPPWGGGGWGPGRGWGGGGFGHPPGRRVLN